MQQLHLFNPSESLRFPENLLEFYPDFLPGNESTVLLEHLAATVPWMQKRIMMYGKELLTPRLTAWYGDSGKSYAFSGSRFDPLPWTPELFALKEKIEARTSLTFNSVLLNYYRDGNDSVAWHGDNEKELGQNPNIASLSLGQARQFEFRSRDDHAARYALRLESGSLLIMKGDLQHKWEHRIPKSKSDSGRRINLTFRTIY
ncbi:alpha-ketoglutarate-dependent dioxygenase AlkB family protein [Dyadobacter sandarakinus]|uniref:Alpha-ketoglutarate-dependent dioxygenase AlkB n=1 Tax=Dyadobacter sandarakinus TaxID=2747268 RepID=A0ABX7I3A8_9BACT|nr:alpha-ketoglutarate-dependent dioxygenase AlkB [Dyadobacter sandarakinus]QRR00549.1 alpha-ketoglutarate-dependent dioxygenase AlkB [Dyadobacter sandarakinus]